MKLEQLLQIIKEYDNTFYFRKFIKGEHDRAKKLKEFVEELAQPSEYTLLPAEEYQLALLLISFQDNIPLITQCKQLFNHSTLFFKTFAQLESMRLINEGNFSKIHTLDCNKSVLLNELCALLKGKLNARLLGIVLQVVDVPYIKEDFLACIRLLGAKLLLDDASLELFEKHIPHLSAMLNTIKALSASKQLNNTNIKLVVHCKYLLFVSQLLPKLNEAGIKINSELLKSLCESERLTYVDKICAIIIACTPSALDITSIKSLLEHTTNLSSIMGIHCILKLLRENNLLDADSFKAVLDFQAYHFLLENTLTTLDKCNLLDSASFKKLINPNTNIAACDEWFRCLDDINLLNKDTLALPIPQNMSYLSIVLLNFPKYITLDIKLLTQFTPLDYMQLAKINNIIALLDKKQLLNEGNLDALLQLSKDYHAKLLQLISNLDDKDLLNTGTLDTLFLILKNKLPKPQEQPFTIKAHYDADFLITQFQSDTPNLTLYIKQAVEAEDEEILKGGQAEIFRARETEGNGETQFLIKSFFKQGDKERVDKAALRETKYTQFLGRQSHFFQSNNHWYVISKWQTGQALHDIPADELMAIPLKMRLKSLCYLLHELSQLHKRFRIHGDIKNQNCVLDKETNQLKLIDFGSTRKVKPKQYAIAWTPNYLDAGGWDPTNRLSFCDDIYALGLVTASLFPELYEVTFAHHNSQIRLKQTENLPITHEAIDYLVTSMLSKNKHARCTSHIATQYCQYLFTHFDTLDAEQLASFLEKTLDKKACSFDDVVLDKHEIQSVSMI